METDFSIPMWIYQTEQLLFAQFEHENKMYCEAACYWFLLDLMLPLSLLVKTFSFVVDLYHLVCT